ncbi:uncharacterized protein LOC127806910 [Diospyros lotus]|uniref:uncharacterized protein LOC127806910 n=1 Tax=Diospyros lotus TaxID=55363 RepID=UPI00225A14C1|nr:uncharacterized protein LOC127806910 [Diospyros lotus]
MDLCKNLLSHHLDMEDNSILHLAGTLAPLSKLKLIPGAVLQMQREMQWFQEVKKFLPSKFRLKDNEFGETPAARFTVQHEDLVREGENWMKGVANSCTIVASLIATIAFAAAITVPSGNHDNTGLPIFSNESAFIVFVFLNALSLFTAATSLLIHLHFTIWGK